MRPALSSATGVGVYLQNLISALSEVDQQNEYYLFSSSWKERYPPVSHAVNFKICDKHWPVRILNFTWNHLSLPPIEYFLKTSIQVVHSPTPLVIPTRKARTITTVHDLYFFKNPDQTVREMRSDYPKMLKKNCLKSDAIIAVSDYTKKQLIELVGVPSSRIYTIRHGMDSFYLERASTAEKSEALQRLGISLPFLLFVGTQEPRKNLSVLLEAFENLREDVSLVIAGPPGWGIQQMEIPKKAILTGYLPRNDLRALYQQASAIVFPSLEEGFGLPLIEGMASETPVIASQIPAFQEVANQSCIYFDPTSPEELAEKIRSVLHDQLLRETLIAKGKERVKKFSWKETAQKTLDLYNSL